MIWSEECTTFYVLYQGFILCSYSLGCSSDDFIPFSYEFLQNTPVSHLKLLSCSWIIESCVNFHVKMFPLWGKHKIPELLWTYIFTGLFSVMCIHHILQIVKHMYVNGSSFVIPLLVWNIWQYCQSAIVTFVYDCVHKCTNFVHYVEWLFHHHSWIMLIVVWLVFYHHCLCSSIW